MKKTYFNPAMARFVNPITGRQRRSTLFGHAAFKTDAHSDDDDEEAEKKELLKRVKKVTVDELNERGVKPEVIKSFNDMLDEWKKFPIEAVRSLADENKGVLKLIQEQGLKIEALETGGAKAQKDMSIRAQIEKYRDDNKETIASIKNGKQVPLPAFELNLRAAAVPMLPSNTITGSLSYPIVPVVEPGLNDIPRFALTFWDYIKKGRTSSPLYIWVNKTNPQGAAAFIAPGVAKPFISFETATDSSSAKKVAVADKVALELLEDVDGFESWIKDELVYQLKLALNTDLMTNAGDANTPTGIQNLSVAFTATGLSTANPTIQDALRSVVAQMRSGKLAGAITIFINPIDSANMDMSKANSSGVYMLPSFVSANGKTIAGATVVEDNNIPVGSFQAAFLDYYVIKIYKDMYITFGWEMDDFRKNLLTYLCEMRLHQIFNEQYVGAFVFDTYVNVLAGIAA